MTFNDYTSWVRSVLSSLLSLGKSGNGFDDYMKAVVSTFLLLLSFILIFAIIFLIISIPIFVYRKCISSLKKEISELEMQKEQEMDETKKKKWHLLRKRLLIRQIVFWFIIALVCISLLTPIVVMLAGVCGGFINLLFLLFIIFVLSCYLSFLL